jgi:hypothetical protein
MLDNFCEIFPFNEKTKEEQAEAFIWLHLRITGEKETSIKVIDEYFHRASLPRLNVTRIKRAFAKSKRVCRGSKEGTYKLVRRVIDEYESSYGHVFDEEPKITDKAGITNTPFLDRANIKEAHKMAELYIILHCYENSVRKLIEDVLSNKLGENWWDIAASAGLKGKYQSRKEVETKNKWLTPRGASPLFYIDWGDLLSLIRKFESEFLPFVKEIKFIQLRFGELEKVRNIVAHNGYLPSDEDFQRVVLSFRDWCRQVII